MSHLGMLFISTLLVAWLLLAAGSRAVVGSFASDEVVRDLAWWVVRVYARVVHRVRVEGPRNVPPWRPGGPPAGPLIVVSNHTAGVDPLLIQSACNFEIRWMMMREMMPRAFDSLWRWTDIIAVDQGGRDSMSLRTAIRHLKGGGVLGIFAEGGLERPAQTILPYQPGVGLLVAKTKASVLPVVISGTPRADDAFHSLLSPSRARVRFLPIRRFDPACNPERIARELEEQAASELGWPRSAPTAAGGQENP